uniref:C2H2-type domain-containing protein n=1 Tax=Riboviria sp. TaxID=2585031 RepID=A0A8K1U1Y1_9VIRU|nr:MAG: hypothetical protein 2 [Riboviria sp.]
MVQAILQFFLSWQFSDLITLGLLVLGVWSLVTVGFRTMHRRVRPVWLSARGITIIRGEAMQPGSVFRPACTIPRYQVPLHSPGVLQDSFLGYGIRVDDVLVLPTHVLNASGGALLLKGKTTKFLLEQLPIHSEILTDVSYFLLDKVVWSGLGIQAASVARAPSRPLPVTVAGPNGLSTGFVTMNSMPFVLNFTGSTLPGYSGAAYVHNGQVYGMHAGENNGENVGYGMGAIAAEIQCLIYGESHYEGVQSGVSSLIGEAKGKNKRFTSLSQKSRGFSSDHGKSTYISPPEGAKVVTENPYWREEMVPASVKKSKGWFDSQVEHEPNPNSSNWAEQTFGENALPMEMVEILKDTPVHQLEAIRKYCEGLVSVRNSSTFTITPHSVGEDDFLSVTVTEPPKETSWSQMVEGRLVKLEAQVSELIQRNRKPEPAKKKILPFACAKCDRTFSSELGKITHEYSKHVPVFPEQPETAIHGDERVEVQTGPFLGGRSIRQTLTTHSQPKRPKNSMKSLNSTVTVNPSTSQSNLPRKTTVSQNDIVKAFESFQQVISGLLEERFQ